MTACDSPTAPSVGVDERFTLSPGESARVASTDVTLTFLDVQGDSRCPADAICIQGGDAIVRVRAAGGSRTETLELHTGDSSRASADIRTSKVVLTELQPYPFSSRPPIGAGDYRATLVVSRLKPVTGARACASRLDGGRPSSSDRPRRRRRDVATSFARAT